MKIILFLLFWAGLSFNSYTQSIEKTIIKALDLAEKGKYEKALSTYDASIEKYTNNPILYVLKGELITKLNRRLTVNEEVYDKALKEFNYALKLDSTFSPAYNGRALLNLFHQKYDMAIKDFTSVLRYTQDDIDGQFNAMSDRGAAKIYNKDYAGAFEDYNQALKIRPNEVGLYLNMGALHVNLGQFDKAEETFKKGIAIDSTNSGLLNNLALLYIKLGRPKEAILKLEKAIGINPDEPYSYNNLGLAKIKNGQASEALELINKSLAIYPENSYAYKHRAMAYIELGRKKEACDDLTKANQLGYSISFDNEVNELIDTNCKN